MTPPSSNDRFLALFEQSGVAQALVAPDGTITAINAATCAMFGRERSEVVGHPLLSRLPPDGRPEDVRRLRKLLAGDLEQAQFERRLPRKDGSFIDTLVSLAAVKDPDGTIGELLVCLQDITPLKAAQRAAEKAQARWRSLSQNASDVALIADDALLISYVSPSLTQLLGYRQRDVLGTSTRRMSLRC